MDVNALQKLGTGGVGEASKGNLAHPEAYLPLDAQPYLSMLDYQIICDQGSGSVHSKEYGLSEQEFQIRQSQAVQKILHLSSQINKNISIKDPILTALSELGFQPSALGVQELREAIQLILNNKEWIHHMQDQVYPRVAQKFGCKSRPQYPICGQQLKSEKSSADGIRDIRLFLMISGYKATKSVSADFARYLSSIYK